MWKPSPSGTFKINFDGTIFPAEKKSGIGVVIRDSRGLVIASCSKVVYQVLGASEVENMAVTWALSFAANVGVNRAVLEGDSLDVSAGLREDARFLSQQFDELRYSHTKREGNSLAHSLVRYAVGIPDFLV